MPLLGQHAALGLQVGRAHRAAGGGHLRRRPLVSPGEKMRTRFKSAIRTAVFPVAGRGTRFLPATKASPKEMLPVVDKPLIQYAVEEALAAGAQRLVFITGASKRAIEDHFDSDQELELTLKQQGKSDLLNQLRSVLPSYASCIYIRQPAPLGLGHAVLCAQPAVGAEPFFVHLADDLIRSDVACLAQMAQVYESRHSSVLGVQVVPRQDTEKYGIVAVDGDRAVTSRVHSIIEKPKPAVPPPNLAVVGRYAPTPAPSRGRQRRRSHGRQAVASAPPPGRFARLSRPPWAATISRHKVSPSPVPAGGGTRAPRGKRLHTSSRPLRTRSCPRKVSALVKEESMATRRSSDIPASLAARTGTPRVAARPPKSMTPQLTRVTLTAEGRRTMIAENAYLRAERRGFAPGHETTDWLAAEAEIDALLKVSHGGSAQ